MQEDVTPVGPDPLMLAETWAAGGRRVAMATVIETWGSAPRPVGSHLVIDSEGNFEGSVSGGCVEGAVVAEAADVIETGRPTVLEFGVADETAWQVGLSCGGRIRIYVEPVTAG
ncbi:XdhC family protein [Stappia sp. MMSF_3263]|uniref:XdhC family protein n=1 Tax=Stappia sp. MMSF_3263 TaxID=3046693 RepID=UPI00273F3776|nr:XdhC family protein [Stappia sp. MMSF_3263]